MENEMQLEFDIKQNENKIQKKSKVIEQIYLTSRDHEIISFVSDMKFASLENIYDRFFKKLKDGSESKSNWWARERLTELCNHDHLVRIYSFNEKKAYYLATKKSFFERLKRNLTGQPTRPLESINFNTFEHDKLLVQIRTDLEKENNNTNWVSDRKLSQYPEFCEGLHKTFFPDAIYINKQNESVALELEISRKAKKRYHDKIQNYVSYFRQKKERAAFSKVLFIIAQKSVADLLEAETKLYKQYFEIQHLATSDKKEVN